jgi:hypothetical protein
LHGQTSCMGEGTWIFAQSGAIYQFYNVYAHGQ